MEKQQPTQPIKYFKTPVYKQNSKTRPGDVTKTGMKVGRDTVVPWQPFIFPTPLDPGVHFKLRITNLNRADVQSIYAEYMIGNETYQQTLHGQYDIGNRWENNTTYVAEFVLRHDMPDRFLEQGRQIYGLKFKIEYVDGRFPSAPNAMLPEFEVYVEDGAYQRLVRPVEGGKKDGKDNCLLS